MWNIQAYLKISNINMVFDSDFPNTKTPQIKFWQPQMHQYKFVIKIEGRKMQLKSRYSNIIYLNHNAISWKDCCQHWIKDIMKRIVPRNNGANNTKGVKLHLRFLVKHWSPRRSVNVERFREQRWSTCLC